MLVFIDMKTGEYPYVSTFILLNFFIPKSLDLFYDFLLYALYLDFAIFFIDEILNVAADKISLLW